MTDFLQAKWRQASASLRFLVTILVIGLLASTAFFSIAQVIDNDQDGIADDFETFFGMDPNDPETWYETRMRDGKEYGSKGAPGIMVEMCE